MSLHEWTSGGTTKTKSKMWWEDLVADEEHIVEKETGKDKIFNKNTSYNGFT